MLAIVNVSPEDTPLVGVNKYEVRINDRVIATFEHFRTPDGAARCLRDAADAVQEARAKEAEAPPPALMAALSNLIAECDPGDRQLQAAEARGRQ